MRLDKRGNWSLIGLLVTAVVIIVAFYMVSNGGFMSTKPDSELLDKGSKKKTVVGQAMDTGKSEVCRQQLSQIRTGIENYKLSSTDGGNPATFKDIGLGVSNTYFQCPVSEKPYTYDPVAGKVACPTHPDK